MAGLYNKDYDYEKELRRLAEQGNYESAGAYEKIRNDKIEGEGLDYEKTYRYHQQPAAQQQASALAPQQSALPPNAFDSSKYTGAIDAALQKLMNAPAFSYNAEKDPSYLQYKDQYTRMGKQAADDTLAKVSARTGGLASSYAGVASQQANETYMAALADKIPQLRQMAYDMYNNERGHNKDVFNTLYGMNRDAVGDQRYNQEWNYGVGRDAVADQRYNNEWNYGVGRDAVADQRYNNEWSYGVGRDAVGDQRYADETQYERGIRGDDTTYSRDLHKAQTLAQTGDFSGYKALGYSDAEIAKMHTAHQQQMARDNAVSRLSGGGGSGGSSGGGSGGTSGGGSGDLGAGDGISSDEFFTKMHSFGDPYLYMSLYGKDYGLSTNADKQQMMESYNSWLAAQGSAPDADSSATSGSLSNNAARLAQALNRAIGSGGMDKGSEQGRASIAQQLAKQYTSGLISESDVRMLLRTYGLPENLFD